MDINKEVEKYEKKKASLTHALAAKLNGYAAKLGTAVENINSAISTLNEQKGENLSELQQATLQLNKLNKEVK